MSVERCLAFMEDMETRDVKRVERWFSDSTEMWVPPAGPVTGRNRLRALFRAIFRMYADLHWRVTDVHALGDGRFIYFSESWGTIGAGTPYRNALVTVVSFDDEGRIDKLSDYFKDTAVFRDARGG